MLLTERSSNGIFKLFEDGKHLVTYEKGNVDEAAQKIEYYLANKEEARAIARAGREEVLAHHLIAHRAQRIAELCATVKKSSEKPRKYFGWMANCSGLCTRLLKIDTELAKQANVHAMKAAESAISRGEPLDDHLTYLLVFACCFFDRVRQNTSGLQLLKQALSVYPDKTLIALGVIRGLLNIGHVDEARTFAQQIDGDSPERVFASAEEVITTLLDAEHEPIAGIKAG